MTQIPGLATFASGYRPDALGWSLYTLASFASAGALFLMALGCWRRMERIVALIRGFAESGHFATGTIPATGSVAKVEHALGSLERVLRTLEEEAIRDPLTGSFNRRCSVARLESDLSRCVRDDTPFSIVVFDLDDLKVVNDRHGHLAGDEALRHLSKVIQASVRDGDWVSRWGGDEFLVGFWNADEEAAHRAVERVLARLADEPIDLNGERVCLSASAGLAEAGPADDAVGLFARADAALMELKRKSGRRVPRV